MGQHKTGKVIAQRQPVVIQPIATRQRRRAAARAAAKLERSATKLKTRRLKQMSRRGGNPAEAA